MRCLSALLLLHAAALVYSQHLVNQWAVEVAGGDQAAKLLAARNGFLIKGKMYEDIYLFEHKRLVRRSATPSTFYSKRLKQSPLVLWAEQLEAKKRVKRSCEGASCSKLLTMYNDPMWVGGNTWYITRGLGLNMNVAAAWDLGYTGKDTVVTILDDGIEPHNRDLKDQYDAEASYDINDGDDDPTPRYDFSNENRHGTRCAGVVAASPNNHFCSVGVAPNAGIGGIRMLDGEVTDWVEARAVSHSMQHIDVYSASWGPEDDGKTVDGPGMLTQRALEDGTKIGRGGKGSIYVWASGNGGREGDSCACDGYTNTPYTLSVSSTSENGDIPWYVERCASSLASTYSSGSPRDRQIVTTDLNDSCTPNHTGTSASAPLAAGIVALVLSANKRLTWRDMQHITVATSRSEHLRSHDWQTNGVGRPVSHYYGYGLMDAGAMVEAALNWTAVGPQQTCELSFTKQQLPAKLAANSLLKLTLESDGCASKSPGQRVVFLEHVLTVVTLQATRRGEVEIMLQTPMGTRSTLLPQRSHDTTSQAFINWPFLSVHSWGENAVGKFELTVKTGQTSALVHRVGLRLLGTLESPQWLQHVYNSSQQNVKTWLVKRQKQQKAADYRDEASHSGAIFPITCVYLLLAAVLSMLL